MCAIPLLVDGVAGTGESLYSMKKRVIYGELNYAALVREHGYFVDKTAYIAKLERVKNPLFLRPRRSCPSGLAPYCVT